MAFQFTAQESAFRTKRFNEILRKKKALNQTYEQAARSSGFSVSTLKRWAKLLGLDGK